jgi:hypothetical protein
MSLALLQPNYVTQVSQTALQALTVCVHKPTPHVTGSTTVKLFNTGQSSITAGSNRLRAKTGTTCHWQCYRQIM